MGAESERGEPAPPSSSSHSQASPRFIVLGGGCYGTFYARQLLRARDAGAIEFDRITVVDRNAVPPARGDLGDDGIDWVQSEWDAFFDRFLDGADAEHGQFVPSPFNPHLGLGWLMRGLERQYPGIELTLEDFSLRPAIPFAEQRGHGTLVVSHADWLCPVHCVEPAVCPHTRGPRDWDMDATTRRLSAELTAAGQPVEGVHLFHCHHVTYGVGAYPAAELLRAREQLGAAWREPDVGHRFLIGTISRCHGALHLLAGRVGMDTVFARQSNPKRERGASRS